MPNRMTGTEIQTQQNHIDQQHQSSDADANSIGKEEGSDGVMLEEYQENDCQIHGVAMNVLQDEREAGFAGIVSLSFDGSAGRRIEKERAVVGLAVVVAGRPKA